MGALLQVDKFEAAGNDYVFIDGLSQPACTPDSIAERATALADRHFGVGGDGLILLTAATEPGPDRVRMVMWNADGSRGAICGNGLRSLALLAWRGGHVTRAPFEVETDAGVVSIDQLETSGDRAAAHVRCSIPECVVATDEVGTVAGPERDAEGRPWQFVPVDAGNPHAVVFTSADPADGPLEALGRALQQDARFPDGVNVELVQVTGTARLRQRTWERGSGETLACGSGAVAAAFAARATGRCAGTRIEVELDGGRLTIDGTPDRPQLEGPCRHVFRAELPWP